MKHLLARPRFGLGGANYSQGRFNVFPPLQLNLAPPVSGDKPVVALECREIRSCDE